MLSDEIMEKITERLVTRIQDVNLYILKKIAKKLKEIRKLNPTNAQQLVQIMQYGGDYDKIVKELSKLTKINVKDIYSIFEEVTKRDYAFAKQFYDYRKKKYIPWEENTALQQQVKAIAQQTAESYMNLSKTSGIGYMVVDSNGVVTFRDISSTYKDSIDRAILSVSQGKETYDEAVYNILNQLGRSGLKYVEYESGRTMRLDSAVNMNVREGLKTLHNETQLEFGKQFDSDGVEVSVHINPAPDHELVQGRQFSNEEFAKFQNDQDAVDVSGRKFPSISEETGQDRRSISQYNCYHTINTIVVGVSKPIYSDEELQRIIDENEKGFDYEGKHYTMYEGTQLQRKLERRIRTQKDLQILGKESDSEKLIYKSQKKINALTDKYKELSDVSGLRAKTERLRVSGYHKVKVSNQKDDLLKDNKK